MSGVFDNARFRKLLLTVPVKAIELLYDHYYKNLFSLARSLTRDEVVSKDIVQETFVLVWEIRKDLATYEGRSIEHYLVRVVKYKSITSYRQSIKEINDKISYVNGHKVNMTEHSVEEKIVRLELLEEIRKVIKTFPKRERECLLMRIEDEMSPGEIAEELKVTKKAVERSLTSGMKRIRHYWLSKN
jgi:RNA polymerase sigma-70 factor (ECF subfamily)